MSGQLTSKKKPFIPKADSTGRVPPTKYEKFKDKAPDFNSDSSNDESTFEVELPNRKKSANSKSYNYRQIRFPPSVYVVGAVILTVLLLHMKPFISDNLHQLFPHSEYASFLQADVGPRVEFSEEATKRLEEIKLNMNNDARLKHLEATNEHAAEILTHARGLIEGIFEVGAEPALVRARYDNIIEAFTAIKDNVPHDQDVIQNLERVLASLKGLLKCCAFDNLRMIMATDGGFSELSDLELAFERNGWLFERRIGAGGFGSVWTLYHLPSNGVLNVRAALKQIPLETENASFVSRQFAGNLSKRKDVENEYHTLQSLSGTLGMPRTFGANYVDDNGSGEPLFAILAMDYIPGADVLRQLQAMPGKPIGDVVDILKQLLTILSALEKKGKVHGDVKPANLVLSGKPSSQRQRVLYLIDHGSATESSVPVEERGGTTPLYLAPEAYIGEHDSSKLDVWSAGWVGLHLILRTHEIDASLCEGSRAISTNPSFFFMGLLTDDDAGKKAQERWVGRLDAKLQSFVSRSSDGVRAKQLADVIHDCLTFDPRERPSAVELLQYPAFFRQPLGEISMAGANRILGKDV